MDIIDENRIIDKFVVKIFGLGIEWSRPDGNLWPDARVKARNKNIAIELTELINTEDEVHSNRRKLETHETLLQNVLTREFARILKGTGAMVDVSIDLDVPRMTNARIKRFGVSISKEFEDKVALSKPDKLETWKFEIEELRASIEVHSNPNWTQICCNVGYKGYQLHDIEAIEIQDIINRKSKVPDNHVLFDEYWLLLVEGWDGSMRNRIQLDGKFKTWYDKIYLMREFNSEIFELQKNDESQGEIG